MNGVVEPTGLVGVEGVNVLLIGEPSEVEVPKHEPGALARGGKEGQITEEGRFIRPDTAGAGESEAIILEGEVSRNRVIATRRPREGEQRGVPGQEDAARGTDGILGEESREPGWKEGASFGRGEGGKFSFLEPDDGRRSADDLHQDVLALVVLAETADVPREERDRFMHKKSEAPNNTNRTRSTARTRDGVQHKGHHA